jgi:hypothetical protein
LQPTKAGPLTLGKLPTRYQEKGKPAVPVEIPLPDFDVKPGRIAGDAKAPLKLPPTLPEERRRDAAWWMTTIGGTVLVLCLIALALSMLKRPPNPPDL